MPQYKQCVTCNCKIYYSPILVNAQLGFKLCSLICVKFFTQTQPNVNSSVYIIYKCTFIVEFILNQLNRFYAKNCMVKLYGKFANRRRKHEIWNWWKCNLQVYKGEVTPCNFAISMAKLFTCTNWIATAVTWHETNRVQTKLHSLVTLHNN